MSNILDRVADSIRHARQMEPATTQEFLGLQLAARLDDLSAVRHYATLAEQFREGHLLLAYQRAVGAGGTIPLARRFHKELEWARKRRAPMIPRRGLISLKIDRRAMAVAIFDGDHLAYTAVRTLSSQAERAILSAETFLDRLLGKFSLSDGVLEALDGDTQRSALRQAVIHSLNQHGITFAEIPRWELFQRFRHPPAHSWVEVRRIVTRIYPVLACESGNPVALDAAALGLYRQIQDLFNSINQL